MTQTDQLDRELKQFATAVETGKPILTITGRLMSHLAGKVQTNLDKVADADRDVVTAIKNTLPMIGTGNRKVAIDLKCAKYLASGLPKPEPPKADSKK